MNHQQLELLELLAEYEDRYPQDKHLSRFVDFVKSQPCCFSRNCYADGHITASAWIVNHARDKCLLTKHRKLRKWLQLGGHLEPNESPLSASLREASEESGLHITVLSPEIVDVDIHDIPPHGLEPSHHHYDVRFFLAAEDDIPLRCDNQLSDPVEWVTLSEVIRFTTEPSILRLMEKTSRL